MGAPARRPSGRAAGKQVAGSRRHAATRALRGAIVLPCVFAFAHVVIGGPQTSLFASFGTIALLVMVDFGGPRRLQLRALLTFAVVCAVLITIGTVCSRNVWLAVPVTAVVVFAALFSGVINGYFAAARTGAILTFVLPVSLPGDLGDVPARLAGWGLACAVGIPAVLLLLPDRPRDRLRSAIGEACRLLATLVESAPSGRRGRGVGRSAGASELRERRRRPRRWMPYAPCMSALRTGPPGRPRRTGPSPVSSTSSNGCSTSPGTWSTKPAARPER